MFFAFSIIIFVYMACVALREGSDIALRKSFILVALLAPAWLTYNVRSIRLDFRTVHAIVAIGLLTVLPPKRRIVFQPCLTDAAIIALVASLSYSQHLCGALAPLTPVDIAFSWLSTYFVGRLFLQAPDDLDALAPLAARVLALVCFLALVEAFTKHNLLNTVLGRTFGILESGEGYRWGIKRSQGNVSHPIYNGFQLVLFLPIAAYVHRWGWRQPRKNWLAVLCPMALATTVFLTVSRGAQVGLIVAGMVVVFFMYRKLRVPLVLTAVVLGSSLYVMRDEVIEVLGQMAGEHNHEIRMMMIDGEEVEYTGTKHRLLLMTVYREPLAQTGWFGWGGALKDVEIDEGLQRFRSIDSHYILFYLQYGFMGLGLFLTISVFVVFNSFRIAWSDERLRPVAAGLVAGFVALALSMTSVWFAPDYAAIWLFNAGLTCNLKSVRMPQAVQKTYHLKRHLLPVTQLCREGC